MIVRLNKRVAKAAKKMADLESRSVVKQINIILEQFFYGNDKRQRRESPRQN